MICFHRANPLLFWDPAVLGWTNGPVEEISSMQHSFQSLRIPHGLVCMKWFDLLYLYLLYFLCLSKNSNSMQIYLAQDEDLEDVQGLLLLCVRDSCSCSCLGQAKPSSKKQYRKH